MRSSLSSPTELSPLFLTSVTLVRERLRGWAVWFRAKHFAEALHREIRKQGNNIRLAIGKKTKYQAGSQTVHGRTQLKDEYR